MSKYKALPPGTCSLADFPIYIFSGQKKRSLKWPFTPCFCSQSHMAHEKILYALLMKPTQSLTPSPATSLVQPLP